MTSARSYRALLGSTEAFNGRSYKLLSKVLPKVGRSTAGHTGHISEVILLKHGSTELNFSGHTSVLISLLNHFDLIKRSYRLIVLYFTRGCHRKEKHNTEQNYQSKTFLSQERRSHLISFILKQLILVCIVKSKPLEVDYLYCFDYLADFYP